MIVLSPCDVEEARKATLAAATHDSPVYIRLAREKTPQMTTADTPFEIGKAVGLWESPHRVQVAVFATGPLAYQALMAAKELEYEVPTVVYNLHTIKPLDREAIISAAQEAGAVVTVEEHQIAGGMGSAVAELLALECPVPVEFVGVHDLFGQSGKPEELLEHYGLNAAHIKEAIRKASARAVRS
jgi:transketolase